MAVATKTVIFMTGAPNAARLNWNSPYLIDYLDTRIQNYLATIEDVNVTAATTAGPTQTSASQPLAKWRQIPLDYGKASINKAEPGHEQAQFLSFDNEAELEHSEFLEHSLAVFQDLEVSQLNAPPEPVQDESTFVTDVSFRTDFSIDASFHTTISLSTEASEQPDQQEVGFNGHLTDLKRIPTAQHLRSIHPQTMTINVLVSVISVHPTRTIRLRKRTGEMDIIEVLLGDETRAGFTITFWLPTLDSQAPIPLRSNSGTDRSGSLRETLTALRSGHILLVTQIALTEFQGNVYGQSLSKRVTRNDTSVLLLSGSVTGMPTPAMAKLGRVKVWTETFVGGRQGGAAEDALDTSRQPKRQFMLPPDTQPSEL